MNQLDLRPLSLGEILDRTFTLYRRHFVIFLGLVAVPQVISLAFSLAQISFASSPFNPMYWLIILVSSIVSGLAYLVAQGASVLTVADLYLGRTTSIGDSLRKAWDDIGTLFMVGLLNGLVILAGFICFIIPGIYLVCRLLVCVPVTMLENRGPRASLSRSWELTKGFAGRAFLIVLMAAILIYAAIALVAIPLGVSAFANGGTISTSMLIMSRLVSAGAGILISPILLIATSIFYFDLRVRKEAFDLQLLMDPDGSTAPPTNLRSIVPE